MDDTQTRTEEIPAADPVPASPAADIPGAEAPSPEAVTQSPAPEQTAAAEAPKRRKLYAEHIMGIIIGVLAVLLAALVVVCLPYFGQEEDPELLLQHQPQPTMPPAPTEDPAQPTEPIPEPEKNPYGKLDFQFEGRYLGCIKAGTIPGIDVSYYQGAIDWEQVKASGIEFAMIRLGYRGYGQEGKLVEDKLYRQNIQGALDAGLKVGVYFFSQAITVEEALEEADYVLERLEGYALSMPVVYDWEYISAEARTANMDRRTLTDCYIAFCEKIEAAGYTPMPYFNTYQSRNLMNLCELERWPFWLALYSSRMTFPYRIEMWQYTDSGKVPGIEGNVDINLFFVDEWF